MLLAIGAAALAASATAAHAQVPATLTGETLTDRTPGGMTSADVQCGAENGTGTFTSNGIAIGPYPGTYTESGTFTFPTRERTDFRPPFVVAFTATFEIHSGTTVITGTKTLVDGFADCEPAQSPDQPDGFESMGINVTYDAVIHAPEGDFADRGTSVVVGQDRQIIPEFPDRTHDFFETFASSLAAPESLLPGRPGKGCGDKNHAHARAGECKPR
jgi:hypothetical protein